MQGAGEDEVQLDVKPDRHLTYLIAKVSHQLQLCMDRALQAEGVTLTQFSALAHIARRPGVSGAELARLLLTTPQATATLVRRLTALGLVQRPPTGRGATGSIRLTKVGLRKLMAAEEIALGAEAEALGSVSATDQRRVASILSRLLGALPD